MYRLGTLKLPTWDDFSYRVKPSIPKFGLWWYVYRKMYRYRIEAIRFLYLGYIIVFVTIMYYWVCRNVMNFYRIELVPHWHQHNWLYVLCIDELSILVSIRGIDFLLICYKFFSKNFSNPNQFCQQFWRFECLSLSMKFIDYNVRYFYRLNLSIRTGNFDFKNFSNSKNPFRQQFWRFLCL